MDFESVSQSIAQVRSGLIPETFKDEAKLVCSVSYISFWDMWYRFQYFDIILLDLDTDEVLLRVGQYSDNPFSSEDATIRKAFQEIASKMNR